MTPPRLLLYVVLLAAAAPYLGSSIYQFSAPHPFSGPALFNPYAGGAAEWQKANFHAHSRAWGGVTNGKQTPDEVVRSYQSLGFTVAGVSNYMRIAAFEGVATLPLYEHGYNIGKRHQLAIGAHAVSWYDIPLVQFASQKQSVIDAVKARSALVAIVHPNGTVGYDEDDMRILGGYDFVEIANGPFTAVDMWDIALSSGRRVWAVADDDTHDVTDMKRRAVAFNMVNASTATLPDVLEALRAGRTYVVSAPQRTTATLDTALASLDVTGETITVTASGHPATIVFVGQNGQIRRTVNDTREARYTFTADDTYIRTEFHTPATTVFLNPVIRSSGSLAAPAAPPVDHTRTWLFRALILVFLAGALRLLRRRPSVVAS
mgnify:CR=1 FL=1